MSQYTVEQFASELNLPVDLLLDQLKNAGVKKSDSKDELSEEDKSALLNFLRQSHGDSQKPKNKIIPIKPVSEMICKYILCGCVEHC